MRPRRLTPSFRARVWGTTRLGPWFPDALERTGEVWFLAEEKLPILVKFLFTSEKLSVQVHPAGPNGKTEMWYVLRAEPGAKIAVGFGEKLTAERLREAALSGEVERLLSWIDVAAEDVIFTPAGTVHAIGGGLVLCEIQQNNDVTFRLYDYGRPRELHLEQGLAVAQLGPHPGKQRPQGNVLASCEYFHTEFFPVEGATVYHPAATRFHLLIVLEGEGVIDGQPMRTGEVWHVPARAEAFWLDGKGRLLRTWVP